MLMGYEDATLTLFGIGVDSFIEVMSGIGIAVMILHIRQNPESHKSNFEIKALKITGFSFYLLSAGLLVGIIFNLINHHKPETTSTPARLYRVGKIVAYSAGSKFLRYSDCN